MDYYVNTITWRGLPDFPVDITDFNDYRACFDLFEGHMKDTDFVLMLGISFEFEDVVIKYQYAEPGLLEATLLDDVGNSLHHNYRLFIKPDHKIFGVAIEPDESTDIVKIILDYGEHVTRGLQWAAFLRKEYADGTLEQYFDDLYKLEIH